MDLIKASDNYVPRDLCVEDVILMILMKLDLAPLNTDICFRISILESAVANMMFRNLPTLAAASKVSLCSPQTKMCSVACQICLRESTQTTVRSSIAPNAVQRGH